MNRKRIGGQNSKMTRSSVETAVPVGDPKSSRTPDIPCALLTLPELGKPKWMSEGIVKEVIGALIRARLRSPVC